MAISNIVTRATQTNNIVSARSYYDIMFRTSTSGVIKTVEMDFPPGTYVGVALLVEVIGIGPGKISARTLVMAPSAYLLTYSRFAFVNWARTI